MQSAENTRLDPPSLQTMCPNLSDHHLVLKKKDGASNSSKV